MQIILLGTNSIVSGAGRTGKLGRNTGRHYRRQCQMHAKKHLREKGIFHRRRRRLSVHEYLHPKGKRSINLARSVIENTIHSSQLNFRLEFDSPA